MLSKWFKTSWQSSGCRIVLRVGLSLIAPVRKCSAIETMQALNLNITTLLCRVCNCFSQYEIIIKLRPTEQLVVERITQLTTCSDCKCMYNIMTLGRQQRAMYFSQRKGIKCAARALPRLMACPSTPPFHHRAEMQHTHCHIYTLAARCL